jgi:hypothetical protein
MEIEKENKKKENSLGLDSLLLAHLTFPPHGPSRPVDPPPPPPAHQFCAVSLVCGPARPASRSRARVPPWGTDWRALRVIFLSRTRRLQRSAESAGVSPPWAPLGCATTPMKSGFPPPAPPTSGFLHGINRTQAAQPPAIVVCTERGTRGKECAVAAVLSVPRSLGVRRAFGVFGRRRGTCASGESGSRVGFCEELLSGAIGTPWIHLPPWTELHRG